MRSVTLFGTNLCLTRESENPRIGDSQRQFPTTLANFQGIKVLHENGLRPRYHHKIELQKKCGIALLLHVSFNVFLMDKSLLQTSCFCPGFHAGERTYHSFFSKGTSPTNAAGGENQKETPLHPHPPPPTPGTPLKTPDITFLG